MTASAASTAGPTTTSSSRLTCRNWPHVCARSSGAHEAKRRQSFALAREQLEERLYPWGEEVGSNAVEVHVHHLRRKLGPDVIRTVRGVGYLVAKDGRD